MNSTEKQTRKFAKSINPYIDFSKLSMQQIETFLHNSGYHFKQNKWQYMPWLSSKRRARYILDGDM